MIALESLIRPDMISPKQTLLAFTLLNYRLCDWLGDHRCCGELDFWARYGDFPGLGRCVHSHWPQVAAKLRNAILWLQEGSKMGGEGCLPPSSTLVSSVAIHLFVLCILALPHKRPCPFSHPNFLVVGWKVVSVSSDCGHRSWMVNHVSVLQSREWQASSGEQILVSFREINIYRYGIQCSGIKQAHCQQMDRVQEQKSVGTTVNGRASWWLQPSEFQDIWV